MFSYFSFIIRSPNLWLSTFHFFAVVRRVRICSQYFMCNKTFDTLQYYVFPSTYSKFPQRNYLPLLARVGKVCNLKTFVLLNTGTNLYSDRKWRASKIRVCRNRRQFPSCSSQSNCHVTTINQPPTDRAQSAKQMPAQYNRFLPHPFQFIIHWPS